MDPNVNQITSAGLAVAFIPAAIAVIIMFRWAAGAGTAVYATARMLVQLLLIGYVLVYIFDAESPAIIVAVLTVMVVVASLIAIRPVRQTQPGAYRLAFVAVSISSLLTLALVTQGVLMLEPWFSPRYVVPLAGMIVAGSMNAVSLAAERYQSERASGVPQDKARTAALQASLIPIVNSLFAVGLVSLPGMMTGQILSGISPLIAAKYQIVVMTMLFGASGIAASIYLELAGRREPGVGSGPAEPD